MERLPDQVQLPRRDFLRASAGAAVASLMHRLGFGNEGNDRSLLLGLERDYLQYFLQNQTKEGLFADRQGHRKDRYPLETVWRSISASGGGMCALAIASQEPFKMIPRNEALVRCDLAMDTALNRLPHDKGIMPHFVQGNVLKVVGEDARSTVDTGWFLAGALVASRLLGDPVLQKKSHDLFARVDWKYWTCPKTGLLLHGKDAKGNFLPGRWDRLNGETLFLYVLAAGAESPKAIDPACIESLRAFMGTSGGIRHAHADCGLFVQDIANCFLDFEKFRNPGGVDMLEQSRLAVLAQINRCMELTEEHSTFRQGFWGISDGDIPRDEGDVYGGDSPDNVSGTVNVNATLCALSHSRDEVMENVRRTLAQVPHARDRFGFSTVNLDTEKGVSDDAVGIDIAPAMLAVDNDLNGKRISQAFLSWPQVQAGMTKMGFRRRGVNDVVAASSGDGK